MSLDSRAAWCSWRGRCCWAMLPALAAMAAGIVFAWRSNAFCLDDAYIHLTYAKSLRLGDGLSYNPGDLQTGFSSPLWVLLLAAFPVDGAPHGWLKALGIVLHAATAALAALLSIACSPEEASPLRAQRAPIAMLSAALLVALHPLLLQGAVSGMEVPLAAAALTAHALAVARRRPAWAFGTAALAVLARPETLVFAVALGAVLFAVERTPSRLWGAAGALAAFALWSGYCLWATGDPLPNTYYAKSGTSLVAGLWYLARQVLTREAWLVGAGGLVLLGCALRDAWRSRWPVALALAGAWLLLLLATASSRHLDAAVLFYMARYFAIAAPIPGALVAVAAAQRGRRGALLLAPVLVVQAALLPAAWSATRAQEQSVQRLHIDVAHHVAATLPDRAVIAIEAAGAVRYYTPRTMRIVDLLGLNNRPIAHARGLDRICLIVRERPQFAVIPSDPPLVSLANRLFVMQILREFVDPHYAQLVVASRRRMFLVRVDGFRPGIEVSCHQSLSLP